jgi:hypothetical protein
VRLPSSAPFVICYYVPPHLRATPVAGEDSARDLVPLDPPVAMSNGHHTSIGIDHRIGVELLTQLASDCLTSGPTEPGFRAFIQPDDLTTVMIMGLATVFKQVLDDYSGNPALLHPLFGML